jgi:hypothetical protein
MKKCQKCKLLLEDLLFFNSKTTKDGLSARCKECDKQARKDTYSRSEATYEGYRRRSVARKYGLTVEEVAQLLEAQGGCCAICKTTNPLGEGNTSTKRSSFSIDHCHTTGRVRGLLCNACNRGLGFFKDSIENLSTAVAYLNCH